MVLVLRKAMRAIASLGCERGNARHRLKHATTRLPPAGPHTDIQFRREDTANDPNS
jgi:hypothetical protein